MIGAGDAYRDTAASLQAQVQLHAAQAAKAQRQVARLRRALRFAFRWRWLGLLVGAAIGSCGGHLLNPLAQPWIKALLIPALAPAVQLENEAKGFTCLHHVGPGYQWGPCVNTQAQPSGVARACNSSAGLLPIVDGATGQVLRSGTTGAAEWVQP